MRVHSCRYYKRILYVFYLLNTSMRFDMKKESPSMCINLNMLVICLYIKKWWVVFSIPRLKQYKLFGQGKQLLFSDYDIYSRLFNFYQGRSRLSINPGNSQDLTKIRFHVLLTNWLEISSTSINTRKVTVDKDPFFTCCHHLYEA